MVNPQRVPYLFVITMTTMLLIIIGASLLTMPALAQLPPNDSGVVLESVYFDGYVLNDADEAVRLLNTGVQSVTLNGWQLSDGGSVIAAITGGLTLQPGQGIWLVADADSFRSSFGEEPGYQPEQWPGFANSGDEVILWDATGQIVDVVVYLNGDSTQPGWTGAAVSPYRQPGVFAGEGQILYRRRDPASGLPVADTDSESDWAQTTGDVVNGRRVRYPGWRLENYFFPREITATTTLTVAIAPDNAYETIVGAIERAGTSIRLAALTLENLEIGQALAAAALRGVSVSVFLEGAPPGGLSNQERYICSLIEIAEGECWFMISDTSQRIHDRYTYMHAKYMIIDDRISLISSENFSYNSLPSDNKEDGTWGRRGVVLLLDDPAVASYLIELYDSDLDVGRADIFRWTARHPTYGLPLPGYIPQTNSGGITYTVRFPEPAVFSDTFPIVIQQSPENALSTYQGLLELINRAGTGDRILAQQLSERPYWGPTNSNAVDDPNPRLEAMIDAARRGANVSLLLDGFFDDPASSVSNSATCTYVNAMARAEDLSLQCQTGNPTGLGIHNKMVLASVGGRGYVHIGSLNGTELSSKGNREIAIQVQSDEVYEYLVRMFEGDVSPAIYLPLVVGDFQGSANHLLISEIVYDPPGPDAAEFIELVNPTGVPVDLFGYGVGDGVLVSDFEDRRWFPAGYVLQPGKTVVIALSGAAVRAEYGVTADFEIVDSDPGVPNMIDDPEWGNPDALLQLGNSGDEVLLWRGATELVDIVTYGAGGYPGMPSCPLLVLPQRTLERFPYWRDTNDCLSDFRTWPFPSPGRLP